MRYKLALGVLLVSSFTLSAANAANLLAGYLDTTATGSALKVNMAQAATDGYNMVIFGFAKISGTTVSFFNASSENVLKEKLAQAKANGMKALVSFGGQVNTFAPGDLTPDQVATLAGNVVNFVKNNGLDGVDFDIEVKTNPEMLFNLLNDIKSLDPSIITTAAPQINDGKLVTTGDNQDYQQAIQAGLFNYLFLQEYNTPPQNEASYISSIYPTIKAQVPSNTKIVTGEPTAAVAAGATSIYHPTAGQTLTTPEVTAQMLPELKKINTDSQYGGVMGWSLNVDYDPADYLDPSHVPGSFAYGLKDCVINNQCDTPPPPKPPVTNYVLQASNTDTSSDPLGVTLTISDNDGHSFTTDYLAPNSDKIYNSSSNPSAASIEGKSNLVVSWKTYQGGPSGTCPGSFNLTQNMNIMVNVTYQSCSFKQLPSLK